MVDITEFSSAKASIPIGTNEASYLDGIIAYLAKADLFDMPEDNDFTPDVELEQSTGNETWIGPLSPFERQCYAIGQVLQSIITDMMIELEAGSTEKIVAIQRERRVPLSVAAGIFAEENNGPPMTDDERVYMNTLAVLMTNLNSLFDWGVRSRYNLFDKGLVVRRGFVLYTVYDG